VFIGNKSTQSKIMHACLTSNNTRKHTKVACS